MRSSTTGFALGVVATVLVALIAWLAVVYTGAYNVAATDPHTDFMRWTLDTTMHRSVERRSGDVELPESFSQDVIASGAREYAEYCAHCHGAPGQDPAGWSRGMRPGPPHLTEAATKWSAEEVFWIVQNGIKMTGMPAFGPHHEASEIAAITAFVKQLPGLSTEQYAALTRGAQRRDGAAAPAPAGQTQTD